MAMDADAKKALPQSVQGLRERLLLELHDAVESAYRLSVPAEEAALTEEGRAKRARLEAWLDEQARAAVEVELGQRRKAVWSDSKTTAERVKITAELRAAGLEARLRADVEKAAAYTLLNRLVFLRLLETGRVGSARVVTGGWESGGYRAFREMNPGLVLGDDSEGYWFLLRLVFEDLATELPGLFGASISELVPIPTSTLRHVVEELDRPALASCWTDDMTLGWVYQYWNDPERERLDDKLNPKTAWGSGKIERHEIASKTQMFTERYMVDWLLQNSLGPMWLATCRKHGWSADVESEGVFARLEERRAAWRARRDAGEVPLAALMPVSQGIEERWAYYVPQAIPENAVARAPESVRELRILDPAVGSGHFLVVAFGLLVALYREEARHRCEAGDARWSDRAIVERIVDHNLAGIDIDPRAVQIAAAALWLKARQTCKEARPKRMNLVAAALRIGSLPDDDPALAELREEVERETGIPGALTDTLLHALRGADHLGSLLRIDAAVDATIALHEDALSKPGEPVQIGLFGPARAQQLRLPIGKDEARATVLGRIEGFLAKHTRGDDLGLRLRGEQLAAGVRFVRMVREDSYDLVVGNPPYQGTAKMADTAYVQATYPLGKADLYAAFLERGLQLVRPGGTSALITMRNWMFIKQYRGLRELLLRKADLRALADLSWGAFECMRDNPVAISVVRRAPPLGEASIACAPTNPQDRVRTAEELERKRAGMLAGVGRVEFRAEACARLPWAPLIYWWSDAFIEDYLTRARVETDSAPRVGAITGNNVRFVRYAWELPPGAALSCPASTPASFPHGKPWVHFLKGGSRGAWLDPVDEIAHWRDHGLGIKLLAEHIYGSYTRQVRNEALYFQPGVAFTMIGSEFSARAHRRRCVIDGTATSVFSSRRAYYACLFNSRRAKDILQALNPTIHFEIGDVNRLPLFPIPDVDAIFTRVEHAFGVHEAHRETSVEFRGPGPSPWQGVQKWAEDAVDRPEGAPLPDYQEILDPEPATNHLSFALGQALGRFGRTGEGILDPATTDVDSHGPAGALPSGILFLDGTLEGGDRRDGLGQPAVAILHHAWYEQGAAIAQGTSLRDWLRTEFFALHRTTYENRPIHWPLSSKKKTFVAWVTIHRWTAGTLRDLLADHLRPAETRLAGEVNDLREARDGADKTAARNAERRLAKVKPALDELTEFIAAVERCAEEGPPPTDPACAPRETDARYAPDLDDGVMINAAALWTLLLPQWKDPAKWWKELANPTDKKHYDWAHLAMRYWPTRVDARCKDDPSLGVAHGCFWRYHPKRAWAWELRLQDEIGPDFRIEEAPYRGDGGHVAHRAAYLMGFPQEALATVETEALRRRRKKKAFQDRLDLLESGLWTNHARACWDVELAVVERQGAEFTLAAPDEAGARARLIAAEPGLVADRAERLRAAQMRLFQVEEPEEANEEADGDDEGQIDG